MSVACMMSRKLLANEYLEGRSEHACLHLHTSAYAFDTADLLKSSDACLMAAIDQYGFCESIRLLNSVQVGLGNGT
eukprot:1361816-Pleurochrysis_carterae.AAC.2